MLHFSTWFCNKMKKKRSVVFFTKYKGCDKIKKYVYIYILKHKKKE